MRQLKITKPIPIENLSPEELEDRQERFHRIFRRSKEEKLKEKEALRKDLSIYVSQFCEKYYKFKPTNGELSEIVNFCVKFIENHTQKWFERFFIFCLRGQIIYIYKKITMENLLEKVGEITKNRLKEIREKGFDFNLISILGMETNERYTHSAIIAEMLNPKGTHGYGKDFLEKFLETIEVDFNTENCYVSVEEFAGVIEDSRTYIDIIIRNNCHEEILIENKIWAIDQPLQLERTSKGGKSKNRTIIYLTPFGHSYHNANFTDYKAVSYKKHITEWLQKCIELSSDKPLIMQSLNIYKNIVDKLTNQSIYKEMNNDIKQTILSSEEYFKSAEDIARNFAELNSDFRSNFWSSMQEKMGNIPFSTTKNIGNYTYYYEIDEINGEDQVYIQIKFQDEQGKIILNDEKLNRIVEELRIKFNGDENHKNANWNIWFYADENSKFYSTFINNLTIEDKFKILKSEEKDFDGEILMVSKRFREILDTLDSMLQQS